MPASKIISSPSASPKRTKTDGWENLFTGMGVKGKDKRMSTTFSSKSFLDEWTLNSLYVDDGFAKRVVNLLPYEMMREGFKIEGDPDNLVLSRLEEIGAMQEIERLLKWDRLFGGAIMVLGIDDGGTLDTPLNEDGIRELSFVRTYDRYRVTWTSVDLYQDPNKKEYGKVEYYNVYPLGSGPVSPFRVHASRIILRDGIDIPDQPRLMNNGWGASYLQQCFEQLRSVGSIYAGLENIIEDFVFGTLTIENLQELIASGKESLIKDRLELMDLSRHIINTVLLDARETYTKQSSTVTGLGDIVDRFFQALSAVTGIPMRLLMGQQMGGLNNEGKGETEDWYNLVAAEQTSTYRPVLEKLAKVIFLSKKGAFRGAEPKDWKIEFNPLWQLTAKEEAEVRKLHSDTDKNYVDMGALDPAEVALSRFGGDKYGTQIELIADRTPADEIGGGAEPSPAEQAANEAAIAEAKALMAGVAPEKKAVPVGK